MNKSTPLRAMAWKEARENGKWALLIGAAFGLLLCYLTHQAAHSSQDDSQLTGLWQSTQPLTLFVLPLLAGALGFLQINSELRRDQWAFLIHRPAPSAIIFWGKALTGLALYALAATIPYLSFAWWMSTPGNVPAPFSWRLAWPGLATLSLGIVFYFAGMTTAIRAKPWLGSRALPLPAGVLAVVLLAGATHWLFGVAVFLLYIACALAALGSFQAMGYWNGQRRWMQIALASTLLAGLIVVAVVALAVLSSVWPRSNNSRTIHDYQVTDSGQIFRATHSGYGGGSVMETKLTALDGRVLANGAQVNEFYKKNKVLNFNGVAIWEPSSPSLLGGNVFDWYFLRRSSTYDRNSEVAWYFDRLHNWLVGYSRRTNSIVGFIGANGFYADATSVQSFSDVLKPSQHQDYWGALITFQHAVYAFDERARAARKIFSSAQRVISAQQIGGYRPDTEINQRYVAVWTRDKILHLISPQGKHVWSHAFPDARSGTTSLSVAQNSPATRFWILRKRLEKGTALPQTLLCVDGSGKTILEKTLPVLPQHNDSSSTMDNAFFAAAPPIATTIYVVVAALKGHDIARAMQDLSSARSPEILRAALAFLMLGIALSALCALLAWQRTTRYAFEPITRLAWTIGVFALGPLGFVWLRSLFDWPALENCPSCLRPRRIDRENCEHCAAFFDSPMPDGTEIIEPIQVSAA